MPVVSPDQWRDFVGSRPQAHFLQTAEWGELKSAFGWEAVRLVSGETGAQALFRRLPLGLSIGYVPKPDFGLRFPDAGSPFWDELDSISRERGAIFCKIESDGWDSPKAPQGRPPEPAALPYAGRLSTNIQPRSTVIVDLRGSEASILDRMKPKCRYNIGLARKKGVSVDAWDDLAAFHAMATVTGERDGFGVHSAGYYQRAYDILHGAGMSELLVARYEGRPLAALLVISRGQRAWYLYGASSNEERGRMPNYLLQWEAMRWAKQRGCDVYDLWGVPDEDAASLEANFERRNDGLWGVYRFKRGFGGQLRRAVAAVDRVYRPLLYQVYRMRAGSQDI